MGVCVNEVVAYVLVSRRILLLRDHKNPSEFKASIRCAVMLDGRPDRKSLYWRLWHLAHVDNWRWCGSWHKILQCPLAALKVDSSLNFSCHTALCLFQIKPTESSNRIRSLTICDDLPPWYRLYWYRWRLTHRDSSWSAKVIGTQQWPNLSLNFKSRWYCSRHTESWWSFRREALSSGGSWETLPSGKLNKSRFVDSQLLLKAMLVNSDDVLVSSCWCPPVKARSINEDISRLSAASGPKASGNGAFIGRDWTSSIKGRGSRLLSSNGCWKKEDESWGSSFRKAGDPMEAHNSGVELPRRCISFSEKRKAAMSCGRWKRAKAAMRRVLAQIYFLLLFEMSICMHSVWRSFFFTWKSGRYHLYVFPATIRRKIPIEGACEPCMLVELASGGRECPINRNPTTVLCLTHWSCQWNA